MQPSGHALPMVFYNQAAEISGAERVLLTILEQRSVDDPPATLCAPPGPLLSAASRAGVPCLPAAPLVLGRTRNPLLLTRYLLGAMVTAAGLARALRRCAPALVYANTLRSGLVAAMAVRGARPRPKLLVHLHDPVERGGVDRLAARMVGHEANLLLAVSRYVASGFRAAAGKTQVLHNAVDAPRYQRNPQKALQLRRRLGIPDDAPLLTVAGQLTPWKGQGDALEAFARLRAQRPDAHLLLAGSVKFAGRHRRYDTEAYAHDLDRRSRQPDLAGFVHLSGEITDITAVYSATTLLLVPSWQEAFAMVVLEGMAAGCPLIATAVGGNLEIVEHGRTGWLVPPRAPAALADAALRLIGDGPLREALGARAQALVRERHSLPAYMARLRRLWSLALVS